MPQIRSKAATWGGIGALLLFLMACIFLLLYFLKMGYLVVASDPPGGGTVYSHGRIDYSFIQYVKIYCGSRKLRDYPLNPELGADWLWVPKDGPLPAMFLLAISDWVPAVPLFLCAYLCWNRRTRVTSSSQSRCPICGYDLRAHKPGQKCPECGTEIPKFGWRSCEGDR
jgi:hypothetical protein